MRLTTDPVHKDRVAFFRLTHPNQPAGTVVVVAEDKKRDMLLRWVPNTGLWHRADELEADFIFGDDGGVYAPLAPADAAQLQKRVGKFDERRNADRRILAKLKAQPPGEKRTNAEVGLSQRMTRARPTTAKGLGPLLVQARRSGQWRTVALYEPTAGSAPREMAASIRERPRFNGLRYETRIHTLKDRRVEVQARLERSAD